MTVLRQRMIEDMQLRGLAARTQEAYVAAVAQLAKYYHKPPDEISEEELRQYLLYLQNEKAVSASTTPALAAAPQRRCKCDRSPLWHQVSLPVHAAARVAPAGPGAR